MAEVDTVVDLRLIVVGGLRTNDGQLVTHVDVQIGDGVLAGIAGGTPTRIAAVGIEAVALGVLDVNVTLGGVGDLVECTGHHVVNVLVVRFAQELRDGYFRD